MWQRRFLISSLLVPIIALAQPPTPARPLPPAAAPIAPLGAAAKPATPPPAAGAPTAAPGTGPVAVKPGEVLLNFQAADIQAVVRTVAQMTGRNFLLDPRVKGQITIISSKPMPTRAAYEVFVSALKAQGFSAVTGPGGVVKIVPVGEAKQGADVFIKNVPGGGEQMATHVVVVEHASATQLVPLLRPLMAPTSQLSAYEPANALIITDYADNIRRMVLIVEKLDREDSADVTVVPLRHASAADIGDLVSRLTRSTGAAPTAAPQPGVAAGAGGDRFTVIPDLRTNSLLIRTDSPGRLNQLRSLIAKLDVPATVGGQTRVVYLKNAEAVKLAEVLRGLLAGEARAAAAVPSVTAAVPVAGAAAARPGATRAAEASLIQADEATNALIINASDAVYNNLRAVIEKLDVRRAQVYVESLIAAVNTKKSYELGIQWAGAGKAGDGAVGGATNFTGAAPSLGAAIAQPATALGAASGLLLAVVGPEITLADGTTVRSLGGLARALQEKSIGNILSTPNLVTLDNAEAKILVGSEVPITTGSFLVPGATSTTTTVNPFTTTERKEVGLKLKIKPQIGDGGTIKLDISQEVSDVDAAATAIAGNTVTNKRTIETKVVVDDGQTIVLGGLIEDKLSDSVSGVPLLSDLPLIGALFRYTTKSNEKTNLMVFLRPSILRTASAGYEITTDRYDYLRARVPPTDADTRDMYRRFTPVVPPPPKNSTEKDKPRADGTSESDQPLGPQSDSSGTGPNVVPAGQ
jgi:general secretion pathway protein D